MIDPVTKVQAKLGERIAELERQLQECRDRIGTLAMMEAALRRDNESMRGKHEKFFQAVCRAKAKLPEGSEVRGDLDLAIRIGA